MEEQGIGTRFSEGSSFTFPFFRQAPREMKGMEGLQRQVANRKANSCLSVITEILLAGYCWQHTGECVFSSPGWELQVLLIAL